MLPQPPGIGTLVAVARDGWSRPAMVVAARPGVITLHVGDDGRRLKRGDRIAVAWARGDDLLELRTRVEDAPHGSREVAVAIDTRPAAAALDRRVVKRFPVRAEARLVFASVTFVAETVDISALGAGIVVAGDAPAGGASGGLVVRDAQQRVLLNSASVRLVSIEPEADHHRIGLRFADPGGVARDAARLLAAVT